MIKFFRSWCEEIILSSFIVAVLEMLVPDGNIKKYIRVVTGVYMIFAILSPILLNLDKIDLEAEIENILQVSGQAETEGKDNIKDLEKSYEIFNTISNNLKAKEEENAREVQE